MPALVAGIHVFCTARSKTWMAGAAGEAEGWPAPVSPSSVRVYRKATRGGAWAPRAAGAGPDAVGARRRLHAAVVTRGPSLQNATESLMPAAASAGITLRAAKSFQSLNFALLRAATMALACDRVSFASFSS
jgi:hypothetical protein